MKKSFHFVWFVSFWAISAFSLIPDIIPERQWSQFRGYQSSGVLDNANLPQTWNLDNNENVLWNIRLPGLGLSSPVIWGERLFVTTAVSEKDTEGLKEGIYGDIGSVNDDSEHEWKVYCINKNTGTIFWEKLAYRGVPEQKRHPKSSHANSSVATNGKYVVAFFGSEGLYCYDMQGNPVWEKDFGVLRSVFFRVESAEWEFASSPIIYDDKVIIQCDVMENSFVAAFHVENGEEIWKKERDEYPGWCTPNVYESDGKIIVAVNGFKHRGGYDLGTGEEIWKMSGGGDIQIPTPIVDKDLIFFNSAHGPQSPIIAVKNTAKGDITLEADQLTSTHVKWSIPRGGSYMQTMVLYEGLLYNLKWNGQIDCYDAETGESIYQEKLGRVKSFTASPVISDGKLYAVDDEGEVYIVKTGKEFEILAQNSLNETCMVTPSITDGIIFFRTQEGLIAISKK